MHRRLVTPANSINLYLLFTLCRLSSVWLAQSLVWSSLVTCLRLIVSMPDWRMSLLVSLCVFVCVSPISSQQLKPSDEKHHACTCIISQAPFSWFLNQGFNCYLVAIQSPVKIKQLTHGRLLVYVTVQNSNKSDTIRLKSREQDCQGYTA